MMFFKGNARKHLIATAENHKSGLPKVARACGCPPILDMVRKSVRYLELTPPVVSPAIRKSEDILKQRRCGPFWCLPAFQQPGLLKRHTFIAGSAVGFSLQSKADKSEPTP
jgi:hypothetical protein